MGRNLAYDHFFESEYLNQEIKGGFNFEPLAKKSLGKILSPKEWARKIDVSHQKTNEWKAVGGIPQKRHLQIIVEAKMYFLDELHDFEKELDNALIAHFGPVWRNFKDKVGGGY